MFKPNRCAKINVKVLIVLILVTVALGTSLFAAREVRRGILSKTALEAGQAAFEKEDWATASKHLQRYLGRNPDDLEVLKKYAKARLSTRPLDAASVGGAIAAYRRVMQLDPLDEIPYEKLAILYAGIGNFDELAYVARTRMDLDPNDLKAPLWLADALIRLRKTDEAKQTLLEFIKALDALPDKHPEYVQACSLMSQVVSRQGAIGAENEALEWLTKAVDYAPESVEAMAYRARFYRERSKIPGTSAQEAQDKLALARKDLEAADALGTEDPRVRLFLCAEWLEHGELDRTAGELKAVENLPQEALEEHFFDIQDWTVAKFLFSSQLAIKRKAIAEGVSLADEVLTALAEKGHRVRVLPSAAMLYVAAGKVAEARRCLDEYLEVMYAQEGPAESKLGLAYLKALVARAEEKPYVVIDVLQPAVVRDASDPRLWRLLAEAYGRTEQPRRAVSALVQYLRYYPQDPEMTLQLAKEYSKLGDRNKACETARIAESLNPADATCKLLRIGASIYLATEQGQGINTAKLEELSAELAQLRKDYPDRVDIRILQAVIADYLEKPDEAEQELKRAIEQCKEPLRAQMQLVGHYGRAKRITEAIDLCQAACKSHSEAAEPWLSLADLYAANADYDSARSCLKQGLDAVTEDREKKSLSVKLALLELAHGDRTTGIRLLSEMAAQDEQEIHIRSLLLGVREIQADQAVTEKLVGEIRTAEGESGLLWRLNQASLWLSSDDWRAKQKDVTDLLQYCIDADPQWSAPVLLLVGMYEKLNDLRGVEETCRKALVRNPSATDIADRLLALFERQNRFADAQEVLQQIEATPRVADAWQIRMALRAGDVSRAVDELKVRVSNDNQDASSRIQLARLVYGQTKDVNGAFRYLKEAEAITPTSRTLTAVRASILRAEGQTEEAERILDDYIADSNDFEAYWMRAVYLAEEGEFERAEKDYRTLTTFPEKGAAGYSLLGNFYLSSKKLAEAIAILEEGLNAYPADLRLKRELMKILFLRTDPEDRARALEILAALEERLPQDPELMKVRAVQMLQQPTPQSLETARAKLEDVIKLEPAAVDVHLVLINLAMQEGEYETARDSAIRALGSNPDNPALLSARAGAELALGNTQMAVELSRLVLRQDPGNAEALGIAIQSKDSGFLEEARALIGSAAAANPTDEKLLLSLSRVLVALERPQMAIPELEAYCQTKEGSSSVPALVTLAGLYRLSGDMDRAKQRIEQAEQLDGNSLTVIHARFLWLVAQKRFDELSQISSAYLSAKEQNPTTFVAAARILAASDSMELKKEALKLLEHAAILSPILKDARLGLASTLYQTGDADRAVTIYQELLRQYPNDKQTLNDLAWILQEHDRRYDAALELANRGLMRWPDELHLLDTRGTILANMENRLDEARKDFERLVQLTPPDSRQKAYALLKLGRTYVKLNDLDQAKQHLQNALEIDRKINVFTDDERSEITKILQKSGMQAVNK